MCVSGLLDAMRSDINPAYRLVWLCLENHANGARRWSMTHTEIADEISISVKTVDRGVDLLEQMGVLRVCRHTRRKSEFHMIRSYGEVEDEHPTAVAEAEIDRHDVQTTVEMTRQDDAPTWAPAWDFAGQDVAQKVELTRQDVLQIPDLTRQDVPLNPPVRIHQKESTRLSTRKGAREREPDGFAEFYQSYPRKEHRRTAAVAFSKASGRAKGGVAEILAGLANHTFNPVYKFIPHPTTWLNADAWLDQGQPPKRSLEDEIMEEFDNAAMTIDGHAEPVEQRRLSL